MERTRGERTLFSGMALIALATTLMLEALRVFVANLIFVVDQSQRLALGAIVLAVFLAIGLGGPLTRWFGPARTLLGAALVVALPRLALQVWEAPEPRIVLGALAFLGWGWAMIAALSGALPRAAVARGVGLGLGLDVAIRVAFGTVDLPWMPSAAQHALTLLLVVGLMIAAWLARGYQPGPVDPRSHHLPLLAVGPGLALYHLVSGNLSLAAGGAGGSDLHVRAGTLAIVTGFVLALAAPVAWDAAWLAVPAPPLASAWMKALLAAALPPIGLAVVWLALAGNVGAMAGVALFNVLLLGVALRSALLPAGRASPHGVAFWFTTGMLAQAGILFTYYSSTGARALIYLAFVVLAAGSLVALVSPTWRGEQLGRAAWEPAGAVVVLLVGAGVWQLATWRNPTAVAQAGAEVTVMTYNIQSGFARDNDWSLENTARTIEAQRPDVVMLQEVSRGWLVATGADQLLWLADRLDMDVAWGAASDDGLWGNAILSRVTLRDASAVRFSSTQNLKRGAVRARIATASGDLWLVGTHLDNPSGAGAVRREQVDELLRFSQGRAPALVGGDFNADPSDPLFNVLSAAGLGDLGALLGPDAITSADGRRIDYIFATPEITLLNLSIPDVWTSDHRPVVARVRLR